MVMTTNAILRSERYEVAFNRIHQALKRLLKNEVPHFSNLVTKGAKRFTLIKTYHEELYQFAKLRNAMVHDRYELGEYIAEPHEETVKRIEKIADILSKPNYALTIATKPVIYFDYNESIEAVIQSINEHSYSKYPIYDNNSCIGLLSAKAIVKWMANHVENSVLDLSEIKIKSLLSLIEQQPLSFAAKDKNIFDIEEIFENAHEDKMDLEAVIITENGLGTEKPLGIITPWDLIEIDYTAD